MRKKTRRRRLLEASVNRLEGIDLRAHVRAVEAMIDKAWA